MIVWSFRILLDFVSDILPRRKSPPRRGVQQKRSHVWRVVGRRAFYGGLLRWRKFPRDGMYTPIPQLSFLHEINPRKTCSVDRDQPTTGPVKTLEPYSGKYALYAWCMNGADLFIFKNWIWRCTQQRFHQTARSLLWGEAIGELYLTARQLRVSWLLWCAITR